MRIIYYKTSWHLCMCYIKDYFFYKFFYIFAFIYSRFINLYMIISNMRKIFIKLQKIILLKSIIIERITVYSIVIGDLNSVLFRWDSFNERSIISDVAVVVCRKNVATNYGRVEGLLSKTLHENPPLLRSRTFIGFNGGLLR